MKRFTCTLLTISTILISSASIASARPTESGSVQTSTQTSVITGDRNITVQTSQQQNQVNRRNSDNSTDVSVQDAQQNCDVLGRGNVCDQSTRQNNRVTDNNQPNNYSNRRYKDYRNNRYYKK